MDVGMHNSAVNMQTLKNLLKLHSKVNRIGLNFFPSAF